MESKAVLFVNLGSPDSTSVKDVRRYLAEFLMDKRVIDIPALPRFMLVRGIIVPLRAPKSAHKYETIWESEGSPLVNITKRLTTKFSQASNIPTYMAMRYGNPSPKNTLKEIAQDHPQLQELVVVPLYPHYAMSSYETAVEHVKEAFNDGKYRFKLNIIKPFYNHPSYIKALANSIKPYLTHPFDKILFSYHGIPERHVTKSDTTGCHCLKSENCCSTPSVAHATCYRHQVKETTKLVALELGLDEDKYTLSFQSRLGQAKWLQPYTAEVLAELPAKGAKNILVVCPAFVSDCLETLEEINIEGRDSFLNAGGESFRSIPCLNDSAEWIEALRGMIGE